MNANDFNDHQIPPGGWQYHQPQTGWWAPSPVSFTLEQQAENLVKHRYANRAIAERNKLALDFASCKHEVRAFNAKRLGVTEVSPPKSGAPSWLPHNLGAVAVGAKTLVAWLGEGGKAVPHALAEQRAAVCVKCPNNEAGDWTRWFTVPASELIRSQLDTKDKMGLSTSLDAKLQVCSVCACPMRVKVHVPIDVVRKHMPVSVYDELPEWCWMLSEKPDGK